MASLSRQLFPNEQRSNFDANSTENSNEKSVLTALKENIQSQEKERIKNKYERTLKNKENELQEISKKYESLDCVVKKITKANETLIAKIDKLQQKASNDQKKIEDYQLKLKVNDVQRKKAEEEWANLKKELKVALTNVKNERQKHEKTLKENKISMRRSNAEFEEKKVKLESKLTIKQKQQQKLETMLQQKKQQLSETIIEKDDQIYNLKSSLNNLKTQYDHLKEQYECSQNQKIMEYQQFQIQINEIKAQNEKYRQNNEQFYENINKAMTNFKRILSLQSDDQDIITLLGNFAQELKKRQSPVQYKKTIEKLSLELSNSKKNEKDLSNKIQILEDQLAFVRAQSSKNEDFSALLKSQIGKVEIKEHLVCMKEKARHIVAKTQSKLSEVQKNMNLHEQQKKLSKTQENNFSSLSALSNLNTNDLAIRNPLKNASANKMYAQQSSFQRQRVSPKPISQYLKQELQSKKKSLIYLMYRREDNVSTNIEPQNSKSASKSTQMVSNKKRSNSLCNLISTKCRQQIS